MARCGVVHRAVGVLTAGGHLRARLWPDDRRHDRASTAGTRTLRGRRSAAPAATPSGRSRQPPEAPPTRSGAAAEPGRSSGLAAAPQLRLVPLAQGSDAACLCLDAFDLAGQVQPVEADLGTPGTCRRGRGLEFAQQGAKLRRCDIERTALDADVADGEDAAGADGRAGASDLGREVKLLRGGPPGGRCPLQQVRFRGRLVTATSSTPRPARVLWRRAVIRLRATLDPTPNHLDILDRRRHERSGREQRNELGRVRRHAAYDPHRETAAQHDHGHDPGATSG